MTRSSAAAMTDWLDWVAHRALSRMLHSLRCRRRLRVLHHRQSDLRATEQTRWLESRSQANPPFQLRKPAGCSCLDDGDSIHTNIHVHVQKKKQNMFPSKGVNLLHFQ
jgi:hypothetical protein